LVSVVTIQQHNHAVETVAVDAGPSVITAHLIKIGFATLETDLLDELLYSAENKDSQTATEDFTKTELALGQDIVAAARNITYGNAEQFPIENIQAAFGQFLMSVQRARDVHESKSSETVESYRSVLKILQEQVMPNVEALNKANADMLDEIYNQEKSASALSRGLVLLMGLCFLAISLYTQLYLSKRFRRRFNPAMLAAMFCTCLFLQHLTEALANCSVNTKIAKEDAYDSIVSLLNARSDSYEANASRARWLLDKKRIGVHEKYFLGKTENICQFTANHNIKETLDNAQTQILANEKLNLPGFTGYLADEMNNVRFAGEAQSALETLQAYAQYLECDKQVRLLEQSGDHEAALRLGLGYEPNSSNYAFNKYDECLERTLKINKSELEQTLLNAKKSLGSLVMSTLALTFVMIGCTYIGLLPRIEEYAQ
jgi:hypothetical protein